MNFQQLLAEASLGIQVGEEVVVDVAALADNQPAAAPPFDATLFGHKYAVAISFSPKTSTAPSGETVGGASKILAEVELGEEIAVQAVADLSALQSGQGANASFDVSVFGHAYGVSVNLSLAQ